MMEGTQRDETKKEISPSGYRKELGLWYIVAITVGAIFGSAVPFVPVTVIGLAGPAGLVSWVIGLLFILPVAVVYMELGTMWPRAGGVAYYPARSHGPIAGLTNAWSGFIGYTLVMPGVAAATFEYASYFFPQLYHNNVLTSLGIFLAVLSIIIVFYINTRRVRVLGAVNAGFTVLKVALIIVVLIALLYFFKPAGIEGIGIGGFAPLGISGIFLASSATIFAYAGFRQPIDFAEEIKNPGKMIPRAIFLSLAIVFVLFFLESVAFLGVLNWNKIGVTVGNYGGLSSLAYPFTSAAVALGLVSIGILMIVVAVIASYSDALMYHGSAARVLNTMSRYARYVPQPFSKLSKQGIPFNSVLLVLIIAVIYIFILPSFAKVLGVLVDAIVISYAPGAVSLAVFRHNFPNEKRPFRVPFASIISPLAFVTAGLLIFWSGFSALEVAIPSSLVGLFFLIYLNKHSKITIKEVKAGLWFPIYVALILPLSYFSSSYFGGIGKIPFPYDNILFVIITIIFFYIGYFSGKGYTGTGIFEQKNETA
jgi:amino acid transporter